MPRKQPTKTEQQNKMIEKLANMNPLQRVDFLLSTPSRFAKWDKETAAIYIQELIKMNGGATEFRRMMPPELDADVVSSWNIGRRQPSPLTMRLIVSYLAAQGAHTGPINDANATDNLRKDLEKYMTQEEILVDNVFKLDFRNKKLVKRNDYLVAQVKKATDHSIKLEADNARLEKVLEKMS